jgi:alpha 1,6-mannosyltransferase
MAMFVEGGIYTDSDTAPVIPADQWGIPHENATDPLLSHLSRLLSQANPAYISPAYQNHERQLSDEEISSLDRKAKRWPVPVNGPTTAPIVNDGAELGPPSLVVSVESDAISFGWHDWRDVGLSRAVQIVQWTMMVSHAIHLKRDFAMSSDDT